jgi:hypothetical protein
MLLTLQATYPVRINALMTDQSQLRVAMLEEREAAAK